MLNCIIIQGRLKDDVELRYTQSNTAVCSAVLAVQRSRKASNGEYPVDWIDVVFWGKTAEHVQQWFHKGDMAVVRGRLESRDWEDRNGNRRRSWEVQAESIDFAGGSKKGRCTKAGTERRFGLLRAGGRRGCTLLRWQHEHYRGDAPRGA